MPAGAWLAFGVFIVAIALAVWVYQNRAAQRFTLESGDQAVVALLRDTQSGVYHLRYQGKKPVEITGVQVMLAGEILHVDVDAVMLVNGDQQAVVVKNKVTGEAPFRVNPGDTFLMRVDFIGQTLGYNYMYGVVLNYTEGGQERTFQVIDKDFRFLVTVE